MQNKFKVAAISATALGMLAFAAGSLAQTPPPQPPQFPNMTFFITSVGGPKGADYGGLEGAD